MQRSVWTLSPDTSSQLADVPNDLPANKMPQPPLTMPPRRPQEEETANALSMTEIDLAKRIQKNGRTKRLNPWGQTILHDNVPLSHLADRQLNALQAAYPQSPKFSCPPDTDAKLPCRRTGSPRLLPCRQLATP